MQHLSRSVHGDPAGGDDDSDPQLAAAARLRALWMYCHTVQLPCDMTDVIRGRKYKKGVVRLNPYDVLILGSALRGTQPA